MIASGIFIVWLLLGLMIYPVFNSISDTLSAAINGTHGSNPPNAFATIFSILTKILPLFLLLGFMFAGVKIALNISGVSLTKVYSGKSTFTSSKSIDTDTPDTQLSADYKNKKYHKGVSYHLLKFMSQFALKKSN